MAQRSSTRVSPSIVLLVASFGAFLAFLDATIVNVAFPSIRASFPGSTVGELSWVLNAYNIVFAAFLVVCGRLTDLIGRRRAYTAGIALFTLASCWCAAAGNLEVLVAGRVVQALGSAMLVPASLAIVVEAFPGPRRSHAIGLWGATAAIAAGLGPPLGGALVQLGGWRWAFLVNLPFGLLALVASRRMLVESRSPGRRTLPDLVGALLLAGALGLVNLGIIKAADWGWSDPKVLGSFAGAVALGALFVRSSRRHRAPVVDPALVRIPSFGIAGAATIFAGLGFYAYLLNNILWLQYVWQLRRAAVPVWPSSPVRSSRPSSRPGWGRSPSGSATACWWCPARWSGRPPTSGTTRWSASRRTSGGSGSRARSCPASASGRPCPCSGAPRSPRCPAAATPRPPPCVSAPASSAACSASPCSSSWSATPRARPSPTISRRAGCSRSRPSWSWRRSQRATGTDPVAARRRGGRARGAAVAAPGPETWSDTAIVHGPHELGLDAVPLLAALPDEARAALAAASRTVDARRRVVAVPRGRPGRFGLRRAERSCGGGDRRRDHPGARPRGRAGRARAAQRRAAVGRRAGAPRRDAPGAPACRVRGAARHRRRGPPAPC